MFYGVVGALGAFVAIVIALLSRSNFYILAGLAPLFPTFALFAHILFFKEGGVENLKNVILFGMLSILPYLSYLSGLYFLIDKFNFMVSVWIALIFWLIASLGIYFIWTYTSQS